MGGLGRALSYLLYFLQSLKGSPEFSMKFCEQMHFPGQPAYNVLSEWCRSPQRLETPGWESRKVSCGS